jgi:hypothetical protein
MRFLLNGLNCGLQLRPKELNDGTIFPQNRLKTLKKATEKASAHKPPPLSLVPN